MLATNFVKKPPKGSPDMLSNKDLFEYMMSKNTWVYPDLLEELLPKYPGYDRKGLGHRVRQILFDYTKKGLLVRISEGTYYVKK